MPVLYRMRQALARALPAMAAFAILHLASPVRAAWLAPLVSEDPLTLPSGNMDVRFGASYFLDPTYPMFTAKGVLRSENLVTAPELGLRFGIGKRVEIQASFEMIYLDAKLTDGDSQSNYGNGDLRLSTKVRLFNESGWRPALGIRFGTKLPDANRSESLGTDEFDFAIEGLGSKRLGPVTAYLNLGISLLGVPGPIFGVQPSNGTGQDDLFLYDVGVASDWFGRVEEGAWGCRLLGEIVGQTASRFNNDRASIRGGVQVHRNALTLYAGVSGGLDSASETVGVNVGLIYTFDLRPLFETLG